MTARLGQVILILINDLASAVEFRVRIELRRSSFASFPKGLSMSIDLLLGAIVALGLLGYLAFVLLRPEKF